MSEPFTILRKHPELAEQVGLVIAAYTTLEEMLFTGYSMIAPTDPMTSFKEFYSLRSLGKRYELMAPCAARLEPIRARAFEKLWKRFKGAASRRTEIAHVLYTSDGSRAYRRRFDGERVWFEELTPALFKRTMDQYRTLGTDLLMFAIFCGGGYDRIRWIANQTPRPPGVELLGPELLPQDRTPLEEARLAASRQRLGFDRLPPNPDYLRDSVQTNFRIPAEPPKNSRT